MRRLLFTASAAIAGIVGIQAIAQTVDGLDLQAVKRRAAAVQSDAQAFADHVRGRGDAFREEALTVRDNGLENLKAIAKTDLPKGPAGAIDFDEIIAGAGRNVTDARGKAPQFIVFASLSMPEASLRRLIADTASAGGVVVFRGFPNNSLSEFRRLLSRVVDKQEQANNIGIDPRLFRAFDVQAVPTYVAVSSDFDLCSGFQCRTAVPPYDRMAGNVTVAYALEAFANARGPGAGVAAVAARNMKRAAL